MAAECDKYSQFYLRAVILFVVAEMAQSI